jgi:hypothetical protein
MQPHRRVVGGDPQLYSDRRNSITLKVDALEHARVFRLQSRQQSIHACTNGLMQFWVGRWCHGFRREAFIYAPLGSVPSIVIRERIPEYAVKPSYGALIILDGMTLLERSDKGTLQQLLCHGPTRDAGLEKREKLAVIGHESLDNFRRYGRRLSIF